MDIDCRFCEQFNNTILEAPFVCRCNVTDEDLGIDYEKVRPIPSKDCPKLKGAAIKELNKWKDADHELSHCKADEVLCDLLEFLGFSEVVELYKEIEPKYYG